MNNTNEIIETNSNEATASNAESTSTYFIPYYDNGYLCWRRNDNIAEDGEIPDPLPIVSYLAKDSVHAVTDLDDVYDVIKKVALNNSTYRFNIINNGNSFYLREKDGKNALNVQINHGDIYNITVTNYIPTYAFPIEYDSNEKGEGSLLTYFDSEEDDMRYVAILNTESGINKLNNIVNIKSYIG